MPKMMVVTVVMRMTTTCCSGYSDGPILIMYCILVLVTKYFEGSDGRGL